MLAMVFDFGTMFATNIIIMTINSYGGIMNGNNEFDEFATFFCTALPFCVVWSGGFIFFKLQQFSCLAYLLGHYNGTSASNDDGNDDDDHDCVLPLLICEGIIERRKKSSNLYNNSLHCKKTLVLRRPYIGQDRFTNICNSFPFFCLKRHDDFIKKRNSLTDWNLII